MNFPQLIIDELGDISIAILADATRLTDGVKNGLNSRYDLIRATDKHDHIATDRSVERASHGRVDRVASTFCKTVCQLSHKHRITGC